MPAARAVVQIVTPPGSNTHQANAHTQTLVSMSSAAVVDLCASLDTTCGVQVAQRCIQALDGEAAVPAAVVLHTLLTQLWHKQVGHGCKGRWMLEQIADCRLLSIDRHHSAAIHAHQSSAQPSALLCISLLSFSGPSGSGC